MKQRLTKIPCLLTVLLFGYAQPAVAAWTGGAVKYDSSSQHYFQVFSAADSGEYKTWFQAVALALAQTYNDGNSTLDGHLASLATSGERIFVAENFSGVELSGCWIGGRQSAGGAEPSTGWNWLDGSEWYFTYWSTNEPNNYGQAGEEEDCLATWSGTAAWNDVGCFFDLGKIMVEYY